MSNSKSCQIAITKICRRNLKEGKLKMDFSEKLKEIDEEIENIDTEIDILRLEHM